jgi:MFS family permease
MSGSMMAPALSAIGADLGLGSAAAQLTLSIFVLAFAFGPLVLAPLSEIYGRKPVWLLSSLWYVIWNTICGFAYNNALMIGARFLAGLGASAEFAVGISNLPSNEQAKCVTDFKPGLE